MSISFFNISDKMQNLNMNWQKNFFHPTTPAFLPSAQIFSNQKRRQIQTHFLCEMAQEEKWTKMTSMLQCQILSRQVLNSWHFPANSPPKSVKYLPLQKSDSHLFLNYFYWVQAQIQHVIGSFGSCINHDEWMAAIPRAAFIQSTVSSLFLYHRDFFCPWVHLITRISLWPENKKSSFHIEKLCRMGANTSLEEVLLL